MGSVYVAGASAELERCEGIINHYKRAGWNVTFDWTVMIRAYEMKDGVSQPDIRSDEERRKNALDDVDAVVMADLVHFLIPSEKIITQGMWVELGSAVACRDVEKELIASYESALFVPEVTPFFMTLVDDIFCCDEDAMNYSIRERETSPGTP